MIHEDPLFPTCPHYRRAKAWSQAWKWSNSSFYDNDLAHFYESGRIVYLPFEKEVFLIKNLACEVKVDSRLSV